MHDVQALIARSEGLAAGVKDVASARLCPLVQGFALLPITDALARELADHASDPAVEPPEPMRGCPHGLYALAIEVSRQTSVAFMTTFYFGGQGGQDALVWDKASLVFSPASEGYKQGWPNGPVSQALRTIGVIAAPGLDEFDTVGLGKHRETERWAAAGKPL